jgi:hypothetical protein
MPQKKEDRDYKKEYARDHATPEAKKHRAARNKARSEAMEEGTVRKGDGKEVDHIKPLADGGSNDKSNRRVVSRKTNRTRAKPKGEVK